jgi:hypothetical protein
MQVKIIAPASGGESLATALKARETTVLALHIIPIGASIVIGSAEAQTIALTAKVQYTFEGQIDLNAIYIKGNGTDTTGIIVL